MNLISTSRAVHVTTLALTIALAACGGGGETGASPSPAPAPSPTPSPAPTTYTVGVTVNAVGSGESFQFTLGSQTITVTQGGVSVKFGAALAAGTAYTLNQTFGPRACTFSSNHRGNIAANVEVTADCGAPPGLSTLKGELRGPVGTSVVLRTAAGDTVSATVPAFSGGPDPYNFVTFELATPRADGTAYSLSLQSVPAGQTCRVYKGATGTLPVAAGAVKVGCEWTYDKVSRSSDNSVTGSYFDSFEIAIGGDTYWGEGRFVAFISGANGIAGNTNGFRQVFWRDRMSGETRLVSTDAGGAQANGNSYHVAISEDGLTVAFQSEATNLVPGDTNGVPDVFVWSSAGGALATGVTRASVGPGGVQADGASDDPSLSADGSVIAFSSRARNLIANRDTGGTTHVYRRDTKTGANTLLSAPASGFGFDSGKPSISADGKRIAFWSFESSLVAGDTNGLWDIFVYDHTTGSRQRVSLTNGGGERNQGSESSSRVVAPALSGDGRYVTYATTATNLVAGDTNGLQDVFVVDTQTGAVQRVSIAANGAQGNADSPIGQGERPSISRDGTWIAFTTTATNLGNSVGTTGIGNVLMHNRVTGETRLVTDQATGGVGSTAMSLNGAYVGFGASTTLDSRFSGSGWFMRFTDVGRSWWWVD